MNDETLVQVLGDRRYEVERKWARLPEGMRFGFISDLSVDAEGFVYVTQRGRDEPILVFDQGGNYVRHWGGEQIADGHGITVTSQQQILLTDRDAHQVLGFDREGGQVLALGERHSPTLNAPFNHPTNAYMAPNNEIYVCDGYSNFNVHRFAPDGTLIRTWGRRGSGPSEFTTPHAVWVDRFDHVLVGDRENNRIQVFDREGEFVDEWGDLYKPMSIYVDDRDYVFASDQTPSITLFSPQGEFLGRCRGAINGAHGMGGDAEGNLYLAELPPQEITKLVRID